MAIESRATKFFINLDLQNPLKQTDYNPASSTVCNGLQFDLETVSAPTICAL